MSNESRSQSVDTPTPKFVKDAQNNAPHIIRKQDLQESLSIQPFTTERTIEIIESPKKQ